MLNLTLIGLLADQEGGLIKHRSLTSVLTGGTAAMIALTACSLFIIDRSTASVGGEARLWPMILASSCATLLVMTVLQDELESLYRALAAREEQARADARTDPLTGLGNRRFLFDELARLQARADPPSMSALILIDLDHFKRVNDTRGHHFGDALIKAVATRLRYAAPHAKLVRLGGDEFALLVEMKDERELAEVCEELVASFEAPFATDGEECFARGSLGAAILTPELTPSELLRRADIAMYRAKINQSGFQLFDSEMIAAVERRAKLAKDLRQCVASGEGLSAQFQGIFDRSGKLAGVEALLRWRHPKLGPIPPAEIISLAEETQLINEVGIVVAAHGCRAAQSLPEVTVAMNVSYVQLLDSRFRKELERVVASGKISPSRFQIEVRETDFVERAPDMKLALGELKLAGFQIAVDDYGSSTSSLPYLRKLGVSVLKLDPRVLHNSREAGSIAVMRAKVQLARALGMMVVCEGVADAGDEAAALQAGCDRLQGYFLGEPEDLEVLASKAVNRAAA